MRLLAPFKAISAASRLDPTPVYDSPAVNPPQINYPAYVDPQPKIDSNQVAQQADNYSQGNQLIDSYDFQNPVYHQEGLSAFGLLLLVAAGLGTVYLVSK